MNDEKIYKISLITTIIGIMGIILFSGYVNPETLLISDIDKSKIDNQIEVNAIIESVTVTKSNTCILSLNDGSSSINMVIFPSTSINKTLAEGTNITVIAKVTQYKNNLELILEDNNNLMIN